MSELRGFMHADRNKGNRNRNRKYDYLKKLNLQQVNRATGIFK